MKQGNSLKIEKIQQILQERGIGVEKLEDGVRLSLEHANLPNAVAGMPTESFKNILGQRGIKRIVKAPSEDKIKKGVGLIIG